MQVIRTLMFVSIIIIQEIIHEVHIIYMYSKTRHMNIKGY